MRNEAVEQLNQIMYRAQQAHFGPDSAKDLYQEMKGKDLLSNAAIRNQKKTGHSCNLEAAKDVLRECATLYGQKQILFFGAVVYGEKDILKKVSEQRLAYPLVEMLRRISHAANDLAPSRSVSLVFDEQLAARDVAISIRRFVAGTKLSNVSHFPLIAVSNVSPGIQLADLGAHILGRRATSGEELHEWVKRLYKITWQGEIDGQKRFGIKKWDSDGSGNVRLRKHW